MKKSGTTIGDYDLIEANEAFASQALADGQGLDWDWDRVNVNGGAIALGHPIGASGARVLTTLLYAMQGSRRAARTRHAVPRRRRRRRAQRLAGELTMTTLAHVLDATLARASRAVGVVGFAAAVAAASQIAIPLPGTPVPITLQPMLVILAGMWLGPVAGAASMVLYLAAGAAGLPVFTPMGAPGIARFFGPTGGYLLAYPAAAFVAGALSRRAPSLDGRAGSPRSPASP